MNKNLLIKKFIKYLPINKILINQYNNYEPYGPTLFYNLFPEVSNI